MNNIYKLSTNQYGARVIQKILSNQKISNNQILLFFSFIKPNYHILLTNSFAYHIIIKGLVRLQGFPNEELEFFYTFLVNHLLFLSKNPNGCSALQKIIEISTENQYKIMLVQSISSHCLLLLYDTYGVYVLKYVVSMKIHKINKDILSVLIENDILKCCVNKTSCLLIEKLIECVNESMRLKIIEELLDNEYNLRALIMDNYGCSGK